MYSEKSEKNPFVFFSTYNENEHGSKLEEESFVLNNCEETTIVEKSFYALVSEYKGEGLMNKNKIYVKLVLRDSIVIYTKLDIDSRWRDKRVLVRSFNNIHNWKNFSRNYQKFKTDCLRNNLNRVN